MKLAAGRIDSFVRSPDPGVRAVLVYGADRGLVKERADAMLAAVTGDPSDPFRSVEIPADALKADPTRLLDEAAAYSFSGGRRVVRVRGATDAVSEFFEALADAKSGGALVIVEAGELGPRSGLRKLFEGGSDLAALPCYPDTGSNLDQLVHETLAAHQLKASSEAVEFLVANLGGDRAVSRRELEKLCLYKGAPGTITLEDAEAVVGDSTRSSLDAVIFAAFGGDAATLDRALEKAFAEGVQPVGILRSAARHLSRLHLARGLMSGGRSADQAMQALRPPLFFTVKDAFRSQLRVWDEKRLGGAMEILTEAEIACKTTGTPARAVCGRTLIRVAAAARSGAGTR